MDSSKIKTENLSSTEMGENAEFKFSIVLQVLSHKINKQNPCFYL